MSDCWLDHCCHPVHFAWFFVTFTTVLCGISIYSSGREILLDTYLYLYLCVPIGGALLCFSKEKEEDEMIMSIRLKTIGIMAIAELLICVVLFCYWSMNTTFGFCNPAADSTVRYLGHFIFCFQFPAYFLIFKLLLYINRKRNEE